MEKNNKMFNDFKKYTKGLEELITHKVEKKFQ